MDKREKGAEQLVEETDWLVGWLVHHLHSLLESSLTHAAKIWFK